MATTLVTIMPPVPILLVATTAPVTLDSLEMDSAAWVSYNINPLHTGRELTLSPPAKNILMITLNNP